MTVNIIPAGISIALAEALGLLATLFIPARSIGGFVANVTVEESHTDELVITDSPVEKGTTISDHAFMRPVGVVIRAGWSNSSYQALGNPNYVREVYEQLRALQRSATPFTIVTGKRIYRNMLITRLTTTTGQATENSLLLTCECREVIIAQAMTTSLPDPANLASPEANAPTESTGAKQLGPDVGDSSRVLLTVGGRRTP